MEHGGQNAELCNDNHSRCAVMRARPMWRPVHYRMHSSCLDSLRHEIFHQTKAQVKGLSQGELAPLSLCTHTHLLTHTHTDHRKILLGYVGSVKEKWIIDLLCGGATGECLAWTKKHNNKKWALMPHAVFSRQKISPVREFFSYILLFVNCSLEISEY